MTAGEKMLWAAQLVTVIKRVRQHTTLYTDEEWGEAIAEGAEEAAHVVMMLRKHADGIIEGFGVDSDVAKMVGEMLR